MEQLTIFDEIYQPRFQAYLNYFGKTHVSEVNIRDFIRWIDKHIYEFRKSRGMHHDQRLNDQLHKEFTEYLLSLGDGENTRI